MIDLHVCDEEAENKWSRTRSRGPGLCFVLWDTGEPVRHRTASVGNRETWAAYTVCAVPFTWLDSVLFVQGESKKYQVFLLRRHALTFTLGLMAKMYSSANC